MISTSAPGSAGPLTIGAPGREVNDGTHGCIGPLCRPICAMHMGPAAWDPGVWGPNGWDPKIRAVLPGETSYLADPRGLPRPGQAQRN